MTIAYTVPLLVTEYRITDVPQSGQTVTGYGGAIPTRYMIRYAGRWQRVKVMSYGNSGSAYIHTGGRDLFLDINTEHALEQLGAACSGTWQVETAQPAPADLVAAVEVIPWDACICDGRVSRPRGNCWASTHNLRATR